MFGNFDKIFYGPRRFAPAVIPCLLGTGPLRTPGRRAVVPRGGIEPPTRGFSVLCSTD